MLEITDLAALVLPTASVPKLKLLQDCGGPFSRFSKLLSLSS
jgi:hypothetical protein